MPSLISYSALALLAMQAMAGPAHPPHGHRRHHARHGKRACRAKTSLAAGQGYELGAGNGTVPIYISPSSISIDSASASQIGSGNAATGGSSATSAVPTIASINPNAVDPVSGFIASSAASTAANNSIAETSIGVPGGYTTTTAASAAVTSLALSSGITSLEVSSNSSVVALPSPSSPALPPVTGASDKRVFAHFMVGIVSTYAQADWENDMKIAKAHGVDGFALNIGKDDYSQKQLDLAYAAAEVVDFDLFISFDFNWYHIDEVDAVATMFKRYMDRPKQYKVDGKPFVSTFVGDGFDWGAVEKAVGKPIHSVPFYEPTAQNADLPSVSGLFSWSAWPGQLGNKPIKQDMTDERDLLYMSLTDPIHKDYMAPVSPWFFTHFGKEVSYSKNWLFYSETLWYDRWEQILKLQDSLKYLEIVTWNDYGESHYIGPLNTPHTDDGSSRYTTGLDHTAHLEFAVPYIKAFKAGSRTPIIEQDMLVYWYRPHLKSASCDSTDNCGSKPDGWDMVADEVFVATMTKNGGSFTATSGSNAAVTHEAGPGVQVFRVPMGVGAQDFTFTAAGQSGSDSSSVPISAECWNGVYNFNYHSGSIKL